MNPKICIAHTQVKECGWTAAPLDACPLCESAIGMLVRAAFITGPAVLHTMTARSLFFYVIHGDHSLIARRALNHNTDRSTHAEYCLTHLLIIDFALTFT